MVMLNRRFLHRGSKLNRLGLAMKYMKVKTQKELYIKRDIHSHKHALKPIHCYYLEG